MSKLREKAFNTKPPIGVIDVFYRPQLVVLLEDAEAAIEEARAEINRCHQLLDEYFQHPVDASETADSKLGRFIADVVAESAKAETVSPAPQDEVAKLIAEARRLAKMDDIPYGDCDVDGLLLRLADVLEQSEQQRADEEWAFNDALKEVRQQREELKQATTSTDTRGLIVFETSGTIILDHTSMTWEDEKEQSK